MQHGGGASPLWPGSPAEAVPFFWRENKTASLKTN
jgi:hypothetical protein